MPATPDDLNLHPSQTLTLRVPAQLNRQIKALAERDSNSVNATVRRLLAAALRIEQQERERRG